MTSNEVDNERIILIKKIDLENNFYNLFRNTFKVVINYEMNKEKKKCYYRRCKRYYCNI